MKKCFFYPVHQSNQRNSVITPWQQLLETGYEMTHVFGLTITTVGEEQFEVGGVITSALFPMNLLNCNFNPVLWSLQL